MNENLEKCIDRLSPELQQKAKGLKTKEELCEFIADNDLELPDEALELVSGGFLCSGNEGNGEKCSKCFASVSPCKESDINDIKAYIKKRWEKNNKGLFGQLEGAGGGIVLSEYRRCKNCGIVYADEIHI